MRSGEPAHMEQLSHGLFADPLEGSGDKQDLDQDLVGTWDRCAVENTPLTVLTIRMGPFSEAGKKAHRSPPLPSLCARAIAAAVKIFCARPRDRRFQVDEATFAAILPGTASEGSRHVTGHILGAVRDLQCSHRAAPTDPVFPVAVGTATATPVADKDPLLLLGCSMRALAAAEKEAVSFADGIHTSATADTPGNIAVYGSFLRVPGDADHA